jgi:hypothetical protein
VHRGQQPVDGLRAKQRRGHGVARIIDHRCVCVGGGRGRGQNHATAALHHQGQLGLRSISNDPPPASPLLHVVGYYWLARRGCCCSPVPGTEVTHT